MQKIYLVVGLIVVIALAGLGYFYSNKRKTGEQASSPTSQQPASPNAQQGTPPTSVAKDTQLETVDTKTIASAAKVFDFCVTVPENWQTEAVPQIESLNFYDPAAEGSTNLDRSQVFVRHFRANSFQTLSTVTIHSRNETTVAGRPAVAYEIEKKQGVTNFPNQPSWRSERHFVTDVRVADTNPSIFLVFGKRPDLPEKTFDQLLSSLDLGCVKKKF